MQIQPDVRTDAITLTTTNNQITFSSTVNSAASAAHAINFNVGNAEVEFDGIVGGADNGDLGAIGITGNLDLDANIVGAASLAVSGTSNLGANVTTSGNQTYTGDITLSADVGLNTSGGDVQIDGDVNTALVSGGSESGIIQFLGNGSYQYSADGGSIYTTATATSSATTLGTGSLTYSGGSYSWTTPSGVTSTKLLVVGGGGGGGSSANGDNTGSSGGGGAGGLIYDSSYSLNENTNYEVTVGGGGSGGASNPSNGIQGENSVFNDQTAIGGGYGAKGNDSGASGGSGGSGGGGGNDGSGTNGGSGTVGQGNDGGSVSGNNGDVGAGGGGAGEVGESVSTSSNTSGGDGGDGIASNITGSSVNYSGGGGGGANLAGNVNGTGGSGGLGGGGNGGNNDGNGSNGTANSGGGGGGGGDNGGDGGDGGSGIVVVNYSYNSATYAEYDLSINTGAGDIDVNGALANLGELNLTSTSAGSEISGIISTDTIVNKAGVGSLTLSSNNTYTGLTNIDVGTIIATHANALGATSAGTVVDSGAALAVSGGLTVAEPVSLSGTGVASAGALSLISGNNTYSGAITLAADTLIKSTAGTPTLSATINGGYALTTVASDALTVSGVIGGTTPLTKVNLSTTSGNLTLGNNIAVAGTGTDAMIFNAGSSTAAGTTTGGNIILSGSPTLTTGDGGRITFYTGSVSGSTGLTSLIGSGTHRFRYNSDETTTNYTATLSSGSYAIYREQPTLTVTAENEALTYGTTPTPTVTISGMQNGDANGTVVTTAASISIGGATSTSGNYTAGSHTITPSAAASTYGYGFDYDAGTLTVAQKAITVTNISASDKEYNGNTEATIDVSLASFTDLVDGDTVTVSATGTFSDKNVDTGKTVTLSETYAGTDRNNYTITSQGSTTADITAKAITVTNISASDKEYNGNTEATIDVSLASFTDLVDGDTVTVSATGTFSDKNVDTGKTVTLSETYAGTDRNNYTITSQGSTTADITAKAITVTNISASDKEYNGNTEATIDVSLASFTDLVDGDTVTVSATGTFSDKNVDTGKTVTLSETYAGTDRNNYTITSQGSTTADITAKAITVTNISASDKEYNGNTEATIDVSLASFTDLVDGDTVTVSATGTFSDKNVDTGKTVTLSETYAGTDRNNYTITSQGSTTADITAKAITVTNISASDKEYNGNTEATIDVSLASFTDLVDGDTVTVSATGTFSDKNVDTGKTVTLSETYAGTDRNNYTITSQGSTTADITAKAITVTNISASDKEYNGNTEATIDVSLASFTDLVDGDTVTVSATGTFSDKNVDTGKTVTLSETYAGTDRNNYTITSQGSTTADITAKAITVTNISASDKEYNGNTEATIDVSLASFTDLVDGDTVTVSATGTFSDKNVDTGKTVTLSETYAGTDRNNYTITSQGSTTADITAKAITVTNISASDKEYNGNTEATIDVSLASFTDLVDGDTVTVSATGTFSDKNVDTGKTVTLSETYAGTDRNNYTITSQGSTTADITAKAITVTNISASDKEYNGNTEATIDVSLASFTDLVDGDTVTVSATGTFSDKNVDTGKTVTLSETYAGTDRNNYTITSQGSTTADITAKAITVTNISASDKEYNGNTEATIDVSLASFTDLVDGDTVTVSATGTFSDKNVDTGKTVTLSETYAGTDRNNYTITSQGSTTADITAKAITVTNISASDKEYNGNTEATIDVSLASFTDLVDGDTVTVSATGTFSDKNVDTGKTVTLSETYAGTDRNNYTITSQGSTTADITQLASVTWTGSAGDGLWSSATNWAGSAIPDLDNVAQAIIPEGVSTHL